MFTSTFLDVDRKLPLVIRPDRESVDLAAWAQENRARLEAELSKFGAILFRGFEVGGVEGFERAVRAISSELLEYYERSSPRSRVSGRIYSSTDYPASQSIFMHNENSYQHTWPMKLFFFCMEPAERGGETPIADVRRVFERIDPEVRRQFAEKNVLYVRNFDEGIGLPWQTVFQSSDKRRVEEYCRSAGIRFEWRDEDRLRIRQVSQAVATHPRTGEQVWFNHAAFFHISTLSPSIREALLEIYEEEDLPNNSYLGDGSPIDDRVIEHIRDAYRREKVLFEWRRGDVLMIDNMLVAHGREPYAGPRKILVGMAEQFVRPAL